MSSSLGRLTDNDMHLGPLTFARASWNATRLVWSSGGREDYDDDPPRNSLTAYAFGWCARVPMPNIIRPFRIKHMAHSWDAATVARMGRNWYYEMHPREYGFSLSDGFLQIYLGAQTHDSSTTQSWSKFLPWTQWRFIRFSLYGLNGEHFYTQKDARARFGSAAYDEQREAEERVAKQRFDFDDYDGKRIQVTTHIEEREWLFGTGWFKWLSLFRAPKVSRTLDLHFGSEVGPEKGSWKGGTVGHSIEMLPGELHEAAFRRYCAQEHSGRSRKYRITFVGLSR